MRTPLVRLEEKTKATILLENAWGMPIIRHVWLYAYQLEGVVSKKVIAHFTYKGKRKITGMKFGTAAIAEGWQTIDGAINSKIKGNEFLSFDSVLISNLRAKLNNVIVENIAA